MDQRPDLPPPFVIIARRPGQGLVINDTIFVDVVEVVEGRVKLELRAPSDVPIYRGEDFAALERGRRQQDGGGG